MADEILQLTNPRKIFRVTNCILLNMKLTTFAAGKKNKTRKKQKTHQSSKLGFCLALKKGEGKKKPKLTSNFVEQNSRNPLCVVTVSLHQIASSLWSA